MGLNFWTKINFDFTHIGRYEAVRKINTCTQLQCNSRSKGYLYIRLYTHWVVVVSGYPVLSRDCSQDAAVAMAMTCTSALIHGFPGTTCRCATESCNHGAVTSSTICFDCDSQTDPSCVDQPVGTCTGASCYTLTGNDTSGHVIMPPAGQRIRRLYYSVRSPAVYRSDFYIISVGIIGYGDIDISTHYRH